MLRSDASLKKGSSSSALAQWGTRKTVRIPATACTMAQLWYQNIHLPMPCMHHFWSLCCNCSRARDGSSYGLSLWRARSIIIPQLHHHSQVEHVPHQLHYRSSSRENDSQARTAEHCLTHCAGRSPGKLLHGPGVVSLRGGTSADDTGWQPSRPTGRFGATRPPPSSDHWTRHMLW